MSLLLTLASSPIVTNVFTAAAPPVPAGDATTGAATTATTGAATTATGAASGVAKADTTGYVVGFVVFIVVVLVVVALVTPILLLAHKIGKQAPGINASLQRSLNNTADLTGLEETIDHATVIVDGLYRARVQLGG